jgi:hypothetical protein
MLRIKNLISSTRVSNRYFGNKLFRTRYPIRQIPRFYFSSDKNNNDNENKKEEERKRREKENQQKKEEFENWIHDQLNINAWSSFKKKMIGGTLLSMLLFYLFSNQIEFMSMNTVEESDFWEFIDLNTIQKFEVKLIRSFE